MLHILKITEGKNAEKTYYSASRIILCLTFIKFFLVSGPGNMGISGKITIMVKGKGIKTTILRGQLEGDTWFFNDDNSFESDNVGGTWSQTERSSSSISMTMTSNY